MGSKKKDLEIIYSLQWKNKSENGGDKANIIGMYDIPATTLNWEIFKSYLLKNSGTVGEDVKVSYITDSNREFPIESQTDFQIALYAFRRKARLGDVVNLKLERNSDQSLHSLRSSRHSNDAETQFDTEAVSNCCGADSPPEWFVDYMNKFKKTISDEINVAVSSAVANIKPHTSSQPSCYHSRKSKNENTKRRKLPLLTGDATHEPSKDFIKSLKLENKLEHKLEKLENKSKKLKEKKLALFSKSSDSDAAVGCSPNFKRRPVGGAGAPCESEDDATLQMDATPVNTQAVVPHMLGGEIYLHHWKVLNSGKSAWTNETALMFTWGSKALKPMDTIVSVPHLKPGETGTISVRLHIPSTPGQYECYFHFHHKSRRFGHWLGCQIIVDPFDLKGNKSVLDTSFGGVSPKSVSSSDNNVYNLADLVVTRYKSYVPIPAAVDVRSSTEPEGLSASYWPTFNVLANDLIDGGVAPRESSNKIVRDLSSRVDDIKLQDPTDTNCSSDSDNQSIVSLSESNSSKGAPNEYVVVPIPDCFKLDDDASNESISIRKKGADASFTSSTPTKDTIDKSGNKNEETFDDNNNEGVEMKSTCEKQQEKEEEDASSSNNKIDIVMVTIPETNQDSKEYACVMVDGQKVMIPKMLIKSEYLPTKPETESSHSRSGTSSPFTELQVNDADTQENVKPDDKEMNNVSGESPLNLTVDSVQFRPNNFEENDFNSNCSAAGSTFSDVNNVNVEKNRLFIFPQTCPGYEVIQGTDAVELDGNAYNWTKSDTHYAFCQQSDATKDVLKPTVSNTNPAAVGNNNPFSVETIPHVPNYQQTPPEERKIIGEQNVAGPQSTPPFVAEDFAAAAAAAAAAPREKEEIGKSTSGVGGSGGASSSSQEPHVGNLLPESVVSGAVNAVRSVINKIVPQSPGRWENGHWVCTNPESTREANLQALAEMGFWNRDLNATLLARYSDDLSRVVAELVQ